MIHKLLAVVFGGALLMAAPALAQSTNRISGIVRDETGGPIRGVIVRAQTGGNASASPLLLTSATDERGRFVFLVSRSGEYKLTFDAPGFQSMEMPVGVRLSGAGPNLDVKLERHEQPEMFGAMAGIDARALSAQLAAASALMDEGNYDQAIAAYRDIKAKAPALSLANLQIGNAYLAKKSFSDAEAAFQEILKADPADVNGMFAMGTLKEAEGKTAEARDWYQKASAADPRWDRPRMKLKQLTEAASAPRQ